jgi:hypothetical protein
MVGVPRNVTYEIPTTLFLAHDLYWDLLTCQLSPVNSTPLSGSHCQLPHLFVPTVNKSPTLNIILGPPRYLWVQAFHVLRTFHFTSFFLPLLFPLSFFLSLLNTSLTHTG